MTCLISPPLAAVPDCHPSASTFWTPSGPLRMAFEPRCLSSVMQPPSLVRTGQCCAGQCEKRPESPARRWVRESGQKRGWFWGVRSESWGFGHHTPSVRTCTETKRPPAGWTNQEGDGLAATSCPGPAPRAGMGGGGCPRHNHVPACLHPHVMHLPAGESGLLRDTWRLGTHARPAQDPSSH